MSRRAERRHRTEAKRLRRNREYARVCGHAPRRPGSSRTMSPFDCGVPGCPVCHWEKVTDEPRPKDLRRLDPDYTQIGSKLR